MFVVEDLHWADPQVLDQLAAIASAIADGPGLLAMTSRAEGDPIDAAWRTSCQRTPFTTIDLGPLRQDEALSLAGSFIDATQRLADRVVVLTGSPGRIRENIDVRSIRESEGWDRLASEDVMEMSEFGHLRARIWRLLRQEIERPPFD
jgi:ABC-type taurine transport system ATPase subunit